MDWNVRAVLRASVGEYVKGMEQARKATENFKKEANNLERTGEKLTGVGKGLTMALTLPIAGGFAYASKLAMELESAMAGVRKTTDLTDTEFAEMEKTIRSMSKQMPASAVEIASVVEAAGQLGIQKENMADFAKVMIDLGESTNIGSDEAASALARLANITGMPQTEFDRLGSTIVDLGNNFATTESEIVGMGMRLAGTGNLVGLSEAQIMALATSMTSVGINAEAGGSAFSRVMQKMNTAVIAGSEEMKGFAKVSGMSAEEFAKKWKESPQDAITAFIDGLGRAQDSGDDIISTLKELGISGIREVDTLQRLAGAGELMGNAFDIANRAWEENTALATEAGLRYETMESRMAMAKNTLKDAGVTVGKVVAPYFMEFANKVSDVAEGFSKLSPAAQGAIIKVAAFLAVIGPILLVAGGMISAFIKIKGALDVLGTGFKIFITGLKGAKAIITGVATPIGFLGKAIAFLASPIGIAIAAIGAITGVIIYLWKTNEDFRNFVIAAWENIKETALQLWEGVQEKWTSFIDTVKAIWDGIPEFFAGIWQNIKEGAVTLWTGVKDAWAGFITNVQDAWTGVKTFFAELWESIKTTATEAWTAFKDAIGPIVSPVAEAVTTVFTNLKESLSTIWEHIKTIASAVWEIIKNVIVGPMLVVLQAITGDWEGAKVSLTGIWDNIKNAASRIWEAIKGIIGNLVSTAVENIKTLWEGLKETAGRIWEAIKTSASRIWESIKTTVVNLADNIKTFVSQAWETLKTNVSTTVSNIKKAVIDGFENAKKSAIEKAIQIKEKVVEGFKSMLRNVATTIRELPTRVREGFNNAVTAAKTFVRQAVSVGADLILGFVRGVGEKAKALIDAVGNAIQGAINWAKNLLGIRSPSTVFMKFGMQTDEGFAEGIEKGAKQPVRAMSSMIKDVTDMANKPIMDMNLGSIGGNVGSMTIQHRVNDFQKQPQPAYIVLQLGQRQLRGFVEDITNMQGKAVQVEEAYGF